MSCTVAPFPWTATSVSLPTSIYQSQPTQKYTKLDIDLTPQEETTVVLRIIALQESIVEATRMWTHETHQGNPIPADEVFGKVLRISESWEALVIHDLLGISKERFLEIVRN